MENVARNHQTKIAKATLRMPNAIANVMGGPSKKEATQYLSRTVCCSECGDPVWKSQHGTTVYDLVTGEVKAILHKTCVESWKRNNH